MTSAVPTDRNEERRRRVLLGPLPASFLRADVATDTLDADYEAALALHQTMSGAMQMPATGPPLQARLSITIAQAKLVKNYGLTRMDPYVRVRVGHCIYETHTDPSGGKTPRWNKVIHCLLPPGVNSIYLEIFDECSFTMDELIAWAHIGIPPAVIKGETHEDWYPLNGKQGDGMEGMINLVLSYAVTPAPTMAYQPVMMFPGGMGYMPYQQAMPQQVPQPQPQPPQPQPVTEEQLEQIKEMFPSMEKEVIKSVLEANNGDKDAAINSLLQMSE
ncbi:hypothetical protein JYU34_010347 [Plutella xylostella]|uniref:Toll-interacting protein n=1 Tax=Plutella xylostella TaxID=51655 RepID=A0ABQ7QI69_PLUXY|nr:hypothetical protein JYU34_010347 [Plutella xylostella]